MIAFLFKFQTNGLASSHGNSSSSGGSSGSYTSWTASHKWWEIYANIATDNSIKKSTFDFGVTTEHTHNKKPNKLCNLRPYWDLILVLDSNFQEYPTIWFESHSYPIAPICTRLKLKFKLCLFVLFFARSLSSHSLFFSIPKQFVLWLTNYAS